jgi:hypothetical protein
VVSRRSVLVEQSCDHSPQIGLDPLELGLSTPVVLAPVPPPRVDMVVAEEVLDVKCTANAW